MSFKIKMILAIGCMVLTMACSNDILDEDLSTRQETSSENSENGNGDPTTKDQDNNDQDNGDHQSGSQEILPPDETGANPVAIFYSIDEEDTVKVTAGESATAQAPLQIQLKGNVGNPDGYKYICEWRIWSTKENGSEDSPLVTRFEENTTYTLTRSGGYGIKLYVTFSLQNDTIEYESDVINVVISESKLTCPDAFTPNNDSINDTYRITAQSIVKLDVKFFDRWGAKLHTVTLESAKHVEGEPNKLILWDGKKDGKVVENGVYYMNLYGLGSDGKEYKFKKAITVMKGFREGTENTAGDGGDQ